MNIDLTMGLAAIIDDTDYDLVEFEWWANKSHQTYYAMTSNGIAMHRVIMSRIVGFELLTNILVDHKDRNGLNNSRSNLRIATVAQSNRNVGVRNDNSTGFKGVGIRPNGMYRVRIKYEGHTYYLGEYHDPVLAAKVYDSEAKKLFGDFAVLNFPS